MPWRRSQADEGPMFGFSASGNAARTREGRSPTLAHEFAARDNGRAELTRKGWSATGPRLVDDDLTLVMQTVPPRL